MTNATHPDGLTTHQRASLCDWCPASLLLVDGSVVKGIFRSGPSTFVADTTGSVYAVYSERADGVLLLRRDHYKPITRKGIDLFFSAELGRFVTIPAE
jgi:hypothetical protein